MKALSLASVVVLLSSAPAAAADPSGCAVQNVKTAGELQTILSRRAVEVVARAAVLRGETDLRIEQLIDPSATFSLGSGDVGMPLGLGSAGARSLAQHMNADTFRFLDWDYIPTPISDPCASHKVEVEFIDTQSRRVYPITFMFDAGRIVSAAGWSRSFETGPRKRSRN